MLFALSYTRCYVPAQESQDIAIAVKCTEFYEVVSHPLKVNCLCISYQMKRALQNGKIRIDLSLLDEIVLTLYSPQRTRQHCSQVWQKPFLQSCQAIVRGTPGYRGAFCLFCYLGVYFSNRCSSKQSTWWIENVGVSMFAIFRTFSQASSPYLT